MRFLSIEEVLDIHYRLIERNGGLHGIRDMGLLISAIEMPKASMFGNYLHESIFDKASAYFYHIVCNHAFLDGNKRTGTAVSLIFLNENGVYLDYDKKEIVNLAIEVAKSKVTKQQISEFLKKGD